MAFQNPTTQTRGLNRSIEDFVVELDQTLPIFQSIRKLPLFNNIPRVYLNVETPLEIDPAKPLFVIINGTVGSGKTTLVKHLEETGLVKRVITATSRLKRFGEDGYDYEYMRLRRFDESISEYHQSLVYEYDLVEHQVTHGNLYGLPRKNLQSVVGASKIPIIVNEPSGARRLKSILQDQFNFLVVFVVPDSWISVLHRIDESGAIRDNLKDRFVDSAEMLRQSSGLANYYLHNSLFAFDTQFSSGFEEACEYLRQIIEQAGASGVGAPGRPGLNTMSND